jgi:hypothetical protein
MSARRFLQRLPVAATIATNVGLLTALLTWQWAKRQPIAGAPWKLPLVLSLLTLACGAVALVACRRGNRVLLFLLDLAAVLVAAWLFNHLYEQSAFGNAPWLR